MISAITRLTLSYTIYIDVSFCTESFKKVVGLSFSELSFKLASIYILSQSSDLFTQSSNMLNKNTLGVKKCRGNKKQPYLCVTKTFGQVTKPIILVKMCIVCHSSSLKHLDR